jgi:hypothetical protein
MIRRILVLGAIGIAVGFAQNSGVRSSIPQAARSKQPSATETKTDQKKADQKWTPPKTSWGEPDLQGLWPLNHLIAVPLERPRQYGTKANLTDDEVVRAKAALEARNKRFEGGAIPVADTSNRVMRQTSLIVYPLDGRFPGLTEYGKKLQAEMKSSYRPGQTVFDNVDDFSAWDRCITRGLPVSMEPRNYNNGIRIMQSPGYVVVVLEMAHEARVIPTNGMPPLDSHIEQWMGESRGHWEGNTLVIETKNFNGLVGLTSAGVPGSPGPLQPATPAMRVIERFTRTAPDTIQFTMTVDDPTVLLSPLTIAYPMYLDNKYEMFEYACHEGNTAVRNYIETSRYERTHPKN